MFRVQRTGSGAATYGWTIFDGIQYLGVDNKLYSYPFNRPDNEGIIIFKTRQEARNHLDNYLYGGEYLYFEGGQFYKIKKQNGKWKLFRHSVYKIWIIIRPLELYQVKSLVKTKKAYLRV